jgi:hypothetical protein
VVADVLARAKIVSLLLFKVAFILYFVFDAFNGNFCDDANNDILPKPFQECSQFGRILNINRLTVNAVESSVDDLLHKS